MGHNRVDSRGRLQSAACKPHALATIECRLGWVNSDDRRAVTVVCVGAESTHRRDYVPGTHAVVQALQAVDAAVA
jgi:hypothetical protein